MTDQAKEVAFQECMEVDARGGVIQDYIGPDHKVLDMQRFHSSLTNAIRRAREQGQTDRAGAFSGEFLDGGV
jgi:hypothetical protein